MDLIFDRTHLELREVQLLYENARNSKQILHSSQLEPYKKYFVNNESLLRWNEADALISKELESYGFEQNLHTEYDGTSNQVSKVSVSGKISYARKPTASSADPGYIDDWINYAQLIIKACVEHTKQIRSMDPALFEALWANSVASESELWGDLPNQSELAWSDEAYAENLTITDINWLEANLYISLKMIEYLNQHSSSLYSGEVYSNEV